MERVQRRSEESHFWGRELKLNGDPSLMLRMTSRENFESYCDLAQNDDSERNQDLC